MTFTYLFYKHIMFRHSCGVCHFANTTRPSDITLADFWGWEKAVPGFNDDDKGVSLVLLNTEKGREIIDAVKDNLVMTSVPLEKCLQPNLIHPTEIDKNRLKFEEDYYKKGFKYVFCHYGNTGWYHIFVRFVKRIRRFIKQR